MKANRERMEIAMARACMSMPELAEKAGMPRPTLNGVLCGRNVRPATLGKVARALGVQVEDLLEEVKK